MLNYEISVLIIINTCHNNNDIEIYLLMNGTAEDRMSRLTEKLKNIDITDRGGRLGKLVSIEAKVSALESKFQQMKEQQDGGMKSVRQRTSKLVNELEEANETHDHNYNVSQLVDLVNQLVQRVEDISNNNRLLDQKALKVLDDRSKSIKSEISKERKARNEAIDDLCMIIKDTFPKLQDLIAEESARRAEMDENILKRMNQESCDFDLELSKEKAAREHNEKSVYEVIKETVERVKKEIENERRERDNSEQSLMRLLEDSMSKLNSIVHT